MPEPLILTPEQSARRTAELEAQGYTVTHETLPDGTIVVRAGRPADIGLSICLVLGLVGLAFAWQKR